ncbi:hypothetical protein DYB37_003525 [Aphanomyces astaci]|uniref:RRM domain-containing protein n=1 Tax=Aphanomyces astaci TaxID=112090 RepID=A0A397CBR2_APHAT|nr:hypothetical protein DYB36_004827 [Aphanomyces astaci]RHY17831.1 hypothetical protein DYB25_006493 [Aphanomyces astaci]RHY41787.1 hypothetical protein DYB30_007523 [Aphanomyces astaci]RHY52320.1 hypothetical protein DYB38_005267 [Aphanomyces astaci]RHY72787.1 hypothetical protein DYB34_007053 [Aphanomyces astaci]
MVVRLFVGGLPGDVTEDDLRQRFGKVSGCAVESIDLVMAKEKGLGIRDFAYVNLHSSTPATEVAAVAQYIQTYHNTKWKGKRLRVEVAQPDFKERLREEWDAQRAARVQAAVRPSPGDAVAIKSAYSGTRIQFE